jgi:hypothetical protein
MFGLFQIGYIETAVERWDLRFPIRVVDESGEDYLYPRILSRTITLPAALRKAVLAGA